MNFVKFSYFLTLFTLILTSRNAHPVLQPKDIKGLISCLGDTKTAAASSSSGSESISPLQELSPAYGAPAWPSCIRGLYRILITRDNHGKFLVADTPIAKVLNALFFLSNDGETFKVIQNPNYPAAYITPTMVGHVLAWLGNDEQMSALEIVKPAFFTAMAAALGDENVGKIAEKIAHEKEKKDLSFFITTPNSLDNKAVQALGKETAAQTKPLRTQLIAGIKNLAVSIEALNEIKHNQLELIPLLKQILVSFVWNKIEKRAYVQGYLDAVAQTHIDLPQTHFTPNELSGEPQHQHLTPAEIDELIVAQRLSDNVSSFGFPSLLEYRDDMVSPLTKGPFSNCGEAMTNMFFDMLLYTQDEDGTERFETGKLNFFDQENQHVQLIKDFYKTHPFDARHSRSSSQDWVNLLPIQPSISGPTDVLNPGGTPEGSLANFNKLLVAMTGKSLAEIEAHFSNKFTFTHAEDQQDARMGQYTAIKCQKKDNPEPATLDFAFFGQHFHLYKTGEQQVRNFLHPSSQSFLRRQGLLAAPAGLSAIESSKYSAAQQLRTLWALASSYDHVATNGNARELITKTILWLGGATCLNDNFLFQLLSCLIHNAQPDPEDHAYLLREAYSSFGGQLGDKYVDLLCATTATIGEMTRFTELLYSGQAQYNFIAEPQFLVEKIANKVARLLQTMGDEKEFSLARINLLQLCFAECFIPSMNNDINWFFGESPSTAGSQEANESDESFDWYSGAVVLEEAESEHHEVNDAGLKTTFKYLPPQEQEHVGYERRALQEKIQRGRDFFVAVVSSLLPACIGEKSDNKKLLTKFFTEVLLGEWFLYKWTKVAVDTIQQELQKMSDALTPDTDAYEEDHAFITECSEALASMPTRREEAENVNKAQHDWPWEGREHRQINHLIFREEQKAEEARRQAWADEQQRAAESAPFFAASSSQSHATTDDYYYFTD